MDELIDTAEKKVLVDIVKMVQKRGMKGTKGDWKEFLNSYDKKFGSSLSDPARRSNDVLASFLKTFDKENDLKFLANVMQCCSNRKLVDELAKRNPDKETPVQRLVCLTLQHPQYALEYAFPSYEEGWVVTKLCKKSKVRRSDDMVAIDCEMVECVDGTEALVKICVVDRNLEVKLDKLVKPNKGVANYRTEITGITDADLDGVTCSLADIQKSMKKLLSNGTILVGHSVNNDLKVLKVDHAWVIDTSLIFKYSDGPTFRRPSLNNLCKSVLGYEVRQKGAPHNCLDDACAAMKLVLAKIDLQVANISIIDEDVPETNMAKLLLHRIPVHMPSEELHKIMPGNFTIEVKPSKKPQGDKYSVYVVYKNSQEAQQAYEDVKGNQEKDSYGRPQKLVTFQLSTGIVGNLYVRKMAHDDSVQQVSSKKRALQVEENSVMSKKLITERTILKENLADSKQLCDHLKEIESLKEQLKQTSDQCSDHLEEIERLKQELGNRDFEISVLNKMVSKLQKDKKLKKK
ncbi:small RNA degrading nuclease 3 isoform X2 [Ziziphus jujuba]|uniref:Small RNA degrading nuclease 3 isoform X2 n=1 Tax=Ziziphus jujuba TaxID=326968 RepID=A0A9B4AHZ4_ZIZJJ|nr:small RNA degrading nuclease 3 isoform X2 [Ziziphus jujuba]